MKLVKSSNSPANKIVCEVTLQPIQDAGRVEDYRQQQHRITLSEVRSKLAEQSSLFTLADVVPVPCNPDNLAMAMLLKCLPALHH